MSGSGSGARTPSAPPTAGSVAGAGHPSAGVPGDVGAERDALRRAAAELGLCLPDLAFDRLLAYLELLRKWNVAYNLTAVRDPAQMRVQHLADCLAAIGPLRSKWDELGVGGRAAGQPALKLLDVGSGAGLPGVLLATVEPMWDVSCVDAVGKKAAFVRQVAAELALANLHALHARVEALSGPGFDVITSRAFAALPDFVRLTRKLLAPGGVWMAMKGRVPDTEIAGLPAGIEVFHVEPLVVPGLDANRCLIWMRPR